MGTRKFSSELYRYMSEFQRGQLSVTNPAGYAHLRKSHEAELRAELLDLATFRAFELLTEPHVLN